MHYLLKFYTPSKGVKKVIIYIMVQIYTSTGDPHPTYFRLDHPIVKNHSWISHTYMLNKYIYTYSEVLSLQKVCLLWISVDLWLNKYVQGANVDTPEVL